MLRMEGVGGTYNDMISPGRVRVNTLDPLLFLMNHALTVLVSNVPRSTVSF